VITASQCRSVEALPLPPSSLSPPQAGQLEQQLAAELAERQRAQQRGADLQRELEAARAAEQQQRDSLGGKVATLEWQLQEACAQAAQARVGAGCCIPFLSVWLNKQAAERASTHRQSSAGYLPLSPFLR
jgi:hypothetical protein